MYSSATLIVFCAVILVAQVPNLKINNTKFGKVSLVKQSGKGPNGSMNNDGQTNPIDNEEEEDDNEFKLESTLLKTRHPGFFIIKKHCTFQEDLIRDPHRKVFSLPPQI